MFKLFKKRTNIVVAILTVTAALLAYSKYDSKTAEEYADDYCKGWMKMVNMRDTVAFDLTAPNDEPLELTNEWGTFLINVKQVRPYLNGYKITFSVGNKSDMTFPKPKIKLKWNYLRPEGSYRGILNDWADWSSSFQEKDFTKLEDLKGKSWTNLEFVILPCSADKFEHVEFSIIG